MTATTERVVTEGEPWVAQVEDLHLTFTGRRGAIHALRGLTLEIARSEIVGVVGESGSGKTALGRTLLGLVGRTPKAALTGRAIVCGVDMVTAPEHVQRGVRRDRLGAVFQDPMTSLDPTMRLGGQLGEVAGTSEAGVRLLERVGFPEPQRRLRAYPHELSGGMRQRAMIAMALARNPALVIADEPTTALDTTVQAQILRLIKELQRETHASFLLITHDLGVAAEVADRIAVMYAGRVVESGPRDAVLTHPAHPYTAWLIAARPWLREADRSRSLSLRGEPLDPREAAPPCLFSPRCPLRVDMCERLVPHIRESLSGTLVACHRADAVIALTADAGPGALFARGEYTATRAVARGPSEIAIELSGVTKTFVLRSRRRGPEILHALRGVSLAARAGERVALIGESGSGKSTLLRIVAGLLQADAGVVTVNGPVQMVFQDAGASLTPWLTIGELLGERLRRAAVPRKERRARFEETMRLVGLSPEMALERPRSISGGQRQRVAIARAVVVPPAILLCDEPTSSLDAPIATMTLDLILHLCAELQMTLLFVTHDLAVARRVSETAMVMYLGEIVESGPSREVVEDPRHPYTKALVRSIPGEGKEMARLSGEVASAVDIPTGCPFHPRCPEALASCRITEPPTIELAGGRRRVTCVHEQGRTVQR